MNHTAYIALGSNLGDRQGTLECALKLLNRRGLKVQAVSSFIETDPVGPADQDKYINAAAKLSTDLEPPKLLSVLNEVERVLGRRRNRTQQWGPRTCDLDILLYDDLVLQSDELTIPHPRMHERLFVLQPLAEIAPDAMHPLLHKDVLSLMHQLQAGR